jgi:hypothetical protein
MLKWITVNGHHFQIEDENYVSPRNKENKKHSVSSDYGYRIHPVTKEKYKHHDGLDIVGVGDRKCIVDVI